MISIHVPREGHDSGHAAAVVDKKIFQSTCPARGTTQSGDIEVNCPADFNPRAPRGARRLYLVGLLNALPISIHVPREGHDMAGLPKGINADISIHVPREGHDSPWATSFESAEDFNPRAPRGARPVVILQRLNFLTDFNPRAPRGARLPYGISGLQGIDHFNPRAPRGARLLTIQPRVTGAVSYFNPRAPRGARQCNTQLYDTACCHFNPRAPRGARHYPSKSFFQVSRISIHVPREGHDFDQKSAAPLACISIHVPREGHDAASRNIKPSRKLISIHVPREGHDRTTGGNPC